MNPGRRQWLCTQGVCKAVCIQASSHCKLSVMQAYKLTHCCCGLNLCVKAEESEKINRMKTKPVEAHQTLLHYN